MDIRELSQAVIAHRRERGLHPRRVRNYEKVAERLIARYERIAGGLGYDKDILDKAVWECRLAFDRGDMAKSTFKMVRRFAADIEDVADYGVIGNDNLPPWGEARNPLNRPVSEEAKQDPDNVIGLAAAVLDLMAEQGYSPHTIHVYKHAALPRLVRYFADLGLTTYSNEAIDSYLKEVVEIGAEWDYAQRAYARIAALHVRSVHESGKLHERVFEGFRAKVSASPFAALLSEFERWGISEGLSAGTVNGYGDCVARFLCELLALGLEDISSLTRESVKAARRAIDVGKAPEYAQGMLVALRAFARFAEGACPGAPAFADWLGRAPKTRRRMPVEGYSRKQSDAIAASVDTSLKAGHRDLAMISLGKNTGMRGVDIRNLSTTDIDWRANTISIVQEKTGQPLALPLDKETGEAIATYMLKSRREGGGDTLFLTVMGAVGPVSAGRLYNIIRRHAEPVVGEDFKGHHGPHAFRRGLGKAMVEAGVRLDDAAEVLGHADARSTEPYVAVAMERLGICSVGLDDVPTDRIGWLK